ncbi:MAG TPA: class I SAM-dependent methyltransferase [Acidimicrobiales bacterium]|nr:class I SAM-dependent methyltransferase [Acidimicrobiales bacterium]
MPTDGSRRAWEDWGTVNPLYAILTDPKYRHGGDVAEFLESGVETVAVLLGEATRLGLAADGHVALDFGCGIGRLTRALADHFDVVVGLDIAQSMVDEADRLNRDRPQCRFQVNEGPDLARFADEFFDLVLCLLVLQHLPSTAMIEGYLAELVRVLRPDGTLIVQLPSKVPAHRPPRPPWNTRAGLRTRAAQWLRAVGVSPELLYRHLDWVPEMTMLAVAEDAARRVLEASGGRVVHVTEPTSDPGGTESRIYFVTRGPVPAGAGD